MSLTGSLTIATNYYGNTSFEQFLCCSHVRKITIIISKLRSVQQIYSVFFLFHKVILAILIPKLDLFISLFGALCLSSLGLAFPALIETCVFLKKQKSVTAKTVMIVKNFIIGIFGLAGFIIGTSTSVLAIYQSFSKWANKKHQPLNQRAHFAKIDWAIQVR